MSFKTIFILMIGIGVCVNVDAQRFTDPISLFSKKKTAYITLNDGTKLKGTLKKVKRKKGQVESIKLEMESGDVKELGPDDIDNCFLPQSGFEKFAVSYDKAYNVTRWGEESLEGQLIKDGYGYFESREVEIKRKKRHVLMQVVNPHFNKSITVFYDPLAGETSSMSVGGLQVAGGIDKSYYIQLAGEEEPFRMKKKDYDEMLEKLYGDCDQYLPEDQDRVIWKEFPKHVFLYTENCSK